MNGLTEDYLPGGVHPAYDGQAVGIRALMADGRTAVRVAIPRRPAYALFAEDDDMSPVGPTLDVRVLTVKKCAGPVPWVGMPAWYWWFVAVDDLGRGVAQDVTNVKRDVQRYDPRFDHRSPAYYLLLPDITDDL